MEVEILKILRHLFRAGCPTEVLGCYPSETLKEHEKFAIVDTGRQLLFQRSEPREQLLRWIDRQIFKCNDNNDTTISEEKDSSEYAENENGIKERISCLMSSTASDGLFGQGIVKVEFTFTLSITSAKNWP